MQIPGQALQQLGQTILQLPQALVQFQRLREENEYQNAKLQWVKGVIAFNAGLDDEVETYEERWQDTSSQLHENITGQMRTQGAKNRFELLYTQTVETERTRLAQIAEERITNKALFDAGFRLDDYAREGDHAGVEEQIQILAEYGKVDAKTLGILRHDKHQEAYKAQVRNQFLEFFAEYGGEAALTWLNDPESRKTFEPLSKLEDEHFNSLLREAKQRVGIIQSQENKKVAEFQENEHERLWADFIAEKVTNMRDVQRYGIHIDKYKMWETMLTEIAEKGAIPKSNPDAEWAAYEIITSDISAQEKLDKIDRLVENRHLTVDDGFKYRKKAEDYVLTPEQEAVYSVFRSGINYLIENETSAKKKIEYMTKGSRMAEAFFTMMREDKPLEVIRQTMVDMLQGDMSEFFEDEGILTKLPEEITDKELFDLEDALEKVDTSDRRKALPVAERDKILMEIRESEEKAWRMAAARGDLDIFVNVVDAIYDETEDGWIFYDRPVPLNADGSINTDEMIKKSYRMYKIENVKKALGRRFYEFYQYNEELGDWVKIGWINYGKVEKAE